MSLPNRPPPAAGPPRPRVLVAHELRAYREALAGALAALRPDAEVVLVVPAELDGELARGGADLVFCSRLSAAVRTHARAWVLLYPGGAPRVETSVGGEQAVLADLELAAALALVDRVAAEGEGEGAAAPGAG